MLAYQLTTQVADASLTALDDLSRCVLIANGEGRLTDQEAQSLAEAIHTRRQSLKDRGQAKPLGSLLEPLGDPRKPARTCSYFPPKRRPQRSPDRQKSLERRRRLAASGPIPPAMAARFTGGEQAVLKIVADEVRARGTCALSIPEIAARSGTSDSTVRRAFRAAFGLMTIEERRVPFRPNLTNVVRIVSREWLAWIQKGRTRSTPRGEGSKADRPRTTRVYEQDTSRPGAPEAGNGRASGIGGGAAEGQGPGGMRLGEIRAKSHILGSLLRSVRTY